MQQDRECAVLHGQRDERDQRVRHLDAAHAERRRARAASVGGHAAAHSATPAAVTVCLLAATV